MSDANRSLVRLAPEFQGQEMARVLRGLVGTPGPVGLNLLALDRSGSMQPYIGAVEELLVQIDQDMKGEVDAARRTLASVLSFSHEVRTEVPPTLLRNFVMPTEYRPDGSTALYAVTIKGIDICLGFLDGVTALYRETNPNGRLPEIRCAMTVLTDGGDTVLESRLRHEELLARSEEAIKRGVTLTGIAVGIDPDHLQRLLGFKPGYVVHVPATAQGFRDASDATSQTFTCSMTGLHVDPLRAPSPFTPVSTDGRTQLGEIVDDDQVPTGPGPFGPPRRR